MEHEKIINQRVPFNSVASGHSSRHNNSMILFEVDLPVRESIVSVDVYSKGRFKAPLISATFRPLGEPKHLLQQLKHDLHLEQHTQLYISKNPSIKMLLWNCQTNTDGCKLEISQVISIHKPHLLIIVGASFPFQAIEPYFANTPYTHSLGRDEAAANKAIWLIWDPLTVAIHPTYIDYQDIKFIIQRQEYKKWLLETVYGPNFNPSMVPQQCSILIPITENMQLHIHGECEDIGAGAIGGVIQNCHGQWVKGFYSGIETCGSTTAVIEALFNGLNILKELGLQCVSIATTSEDLFNLYFHPRTSTSYTSTMLNDCITLLIALNCTINLVKPDENKHAVAMSRFVGCYLTPLTILDECPSNITNL